MAPNLSTIRRGPVPASAFCDHCGRNLADCQCSGEAVCKDCSTPAGGHHFGCFRCESSLETVDHAMAVQKANLKQYDAQRDAWAINAERSAGGGL